MLWFHSVSFNLTYLLFLFFVSFFFVFLFRFFSFFFLSYFHLSLSMSVLLTGCGKMAHADNWLHAFAERRVFMLQKGTCSVLTAHLKTRCHNKTKKNKKNQKRNIIINQQNHFISWLTFALLAHLLARNIHPSSHFWDQNSIISLFLFDIFIYIYTFFYYPSVYSAG